MKDARHSKPAEVLNGKLSHKLFRSTTPSNDQNCKTFLANKGERKDLCHF
jgi:hypothetical protein